VHGVEVVGPHLVAARRGALTPGHQELAVLVEFHHARFFVPIGDEEGAVRPKGDVGLPLRSCNCPNRLIEIDLMMRVAVR